MAVLKLTQETRLASNLELCLPLPPRSWALKACTTNAWRADFLLIVTEKEQIAGPSTPRECFTKSATWWNSGASKEAGHLGGGICFWRSELVGD